MLDIFLVFCALLITGSAASQPPTIVFTAQSSGIQLSSTGNSSYSPSIRIDSDDWPGVIRAGQDVATDFGRVTGVNGSMSLTSNGTAIVPGTPVIIAGTIGKSALIDDLVAAKKISITGIDGKWESYSSQIVSNPISGVSSALVIVGSDKRGTIFGLYDISEQMGVSPWYWWADVPVDQRTAIYAANVSKVQGPPSVKYRGIFLNDEQPALDGWVKANYPDGKYGPGFNADFYSRVFELLLRLKANYLWPAMWNSMFYVDDSNNGPMADMYGIVMGTSHTEPMARATNEENYFLSGDNWDWPGNTANVKSFMEEGVTRAKSWDTLWTMGMRGAGDVESPTLDAKTLETIIEFQESVLKNTLKTTDAPMVWCLYKVIGVKLVYIYER